MKLSEDRDYRGAIDTFHRRARNSRHSSVLEDKRVPSRFRRTGATIF